MRTRWRKKTKIRGRKNRTDNGETVTTYRTPELSFSFRRRVLSLAVSPAVAAREMAARKSEAHTAPSTGLTVAASCCTWLGRGRGSVRASYPGCS